MYAQIANSFKLYDKISEIQFAIDSKFSTWNNHLPLKSTPLVTSFEILKLNA